MLKIEKKGANRVDIDLTGKIDEEEMERGLDALIAKSEGVTEGRMLYTITDFAMPTLAALGVEMGKMPALFGLLGKYDKCAVVTDIGWLRNAATFEGWLIPGFEIKTFAMAEKDAAEAWLMA